MTRMMPNPQSAKAAQRAGLLSKKWVTGPPAPSDIDGAHAALATLNHDVKTAREARKAITPEVEASRTEWLVTYGAAKLACEAALRLHGKTHLMASIFDDLAEVHHAKGVHDDPAPPAGSAGGAQTGAAASSRAGGPAQS